MDANKSKSFLPGLLPMDTDEQIQGLIEEYIRVIRVIRGKRRLDSRLFASIRG
jgi:hypothetical protein